MSDIGVKAAAYVTLKNKIKEINKGLAEIKDELADYLEQEGEETDKGHIITTVEHAGTKFEIKNECRVSSIQNVDIIDVLKENTGPVVFTKAVESIQVVRDDVIEVLHQQGKIDDDLLSKLYSEKSSFAFKIKKL